MLIDKNCIIVLVALDKALGGLGYEIMEKAEFISTFEVEKTVEELNLALSELTAGGYVKLKFNDSDEFCVAITALGRQSVEQLEKLRIKELSAKAVVGKSASGQVVVTTIDDSPVYETPQENIEDTKIDENLPAVVEPQEKKRKPAGRIATFFYGAFGGVFGSGIVVGIMYLLTHLGVIV